MLAHRIVALAFLRLVWIGCSLQLQRKADPCSRRVLIVITSSGSLPLARGGSYDRTGNWFNELIVPAMALHEAGFELVYASPRGGPAIFDPLSRSKLFFDSADQFNAALSFARDPERGPVQANVRKLSSINQTEIENFDAIFIPGGFGVLGDLWRDKELGRILQQQHSAGKVTATICAATSALVAAAKEDGSWPYAGYRMTAFTNAEFRVSQPLLAPLNTDQDLLENRGATFIPGGFMQSHVVEDRELLTGQNPTDRKSVV